MDSIAPVRNPHLFAISGHGNGGIVPPWLQQPPVIVLPVEPSDDDVTLPVLPPSAVVNQ